MPRKPKTQATATKQFDAVADAQGKNSTLAEIMKVAKSHGHRGYVACTMNSAKVHAATTVHAGHNGYNHPRALCTPHTPRSYAGLVNEPHTAAITCQRCLASLAKLPTTANHAKPGRQPRTTDGKVHPVTVTRDERIARVHRGETSAIEEIAAILGVTMTPEQRAEALRVQQAQVRTTQATKATTTTKKEGTVPRRPKTSTATTTQAAATTTTETKAAPASNGKPKAPAFTLTKRDAQAVAKELREGTTMKEIRTRYGHSDGSKVRAALRAHGIGSKGQPNPDGLTPSEWNKLHGSPAASATKASKPSTKAKASKPATQAQAEAQEETQEDAAPKATMTAEERKAKRAEYRRNRRAAKKAEAEGTTQAAASTGTRKRGRKPKAAAANPSQAA
jgi:hypothetical protein